MKISKKLARILREEFGLDVNADDFQRLYPSQDQREGGAFVWCFVNPKKSGLIGSVFPASEFVKKNVRISLSRLRWGDIELWPEKGAEV